MTYHYSMQIHRIQLSPLALWQSAGRSLRYQPRAMSMEAINIQLAFGFINDFIAAIRRGSNREWGAGGVNKGVRCVVALCSSANCGKLSLACCCCCLCVCVADDIFTSSKGFYDINSCRWQIIVAIILAATELGPKAEGRQRHVESRPYPMWGEGVYRGFTARTLWAIRVCC